MMIKVCAIIVVIGTYLLGRTMAKDRQSFDLGFSAAAFALTFLFLVAAAQGIP